MIALELFSHQLTLMIDTCDLAYELLLHHTQKDSQDGARHGGIVLQKKVQLLGHQQTPLMGLVAIHLSEQTTLAKLLAIPHRQMRKIVIE